MKQCAELFEFWGVFESAPAETEETTFLNEISEELETQDIDEQIFD